MLMDKFFITSFILFIFLNVIVYCFSYFNHSSIPLHTQNYQFNSYHYLEDLRPEGGGYEVLRGLNVWDAQWYTRIADIGYPAKANFDSPIDPAGKFSYAFFPLYPLIIAAANLVANNIEIAAFSITLLLLTANFVSLYFVLTKLFSKDIAMRTIFLMFFFPFGIFFRSFYTEGLFLLLFVWFSYFLLTKKWFLTAIIASLLFVTRPNGFVLGLVMGATYLFAIYKHKFTWTRAILYGFISLLPFAGWLYFNYLQAGNPLHWQSVQANWFESKSVLHTFGHNIQLVSRFLELHIHEAHQSKLDVIILILSLLLLIKSRKFFFKHYPQLWWASLLIWLLPLLVKDLQSFSRFQSISFPLFLYLAVHLKGIPYYALGAVFFILLLITSTFFVNWYWVG